MIVRRQYLKSRLVCKVTFKLSAEIGNSAHQASLVGEFNDWDAGTNRMKKLKDDSFTITVDLEQGKEYQFRYLLDSIYWENASNADRYALTPFGDSENSVIII